MTRQVFGLTPEVDPEATLNFPPGTVLRGATPPTPVAAAASEPPPQSAGILHPVTAASGEDFVWDFPPGSTLVKNPQ